MISEAIIDNVVAGSAQLALIVTGAALLHWIVRIDAAGVRYSYWRALAALCVVLPWIQSWRQPTAQAVPIATGAVQAVAAGVSAAAADPVGHTNWAAVAALAIVVGAVARLVWIAAGFVELRRLRAEAALDATSAVDSDLQEALGTHAEIRYVRTLQHPVTFGVFRPVVLLPGSLRAQSADIQRAVLAHELLHVQRRDWGWLVVEEIVRAALWFQPAAWWLISRIQLAREEVVDELAVMLTGRRRTYVEALLAFSDPTSLAPTAAFARRRHLFRRIGLVSREVAMSSKRIVASCTVMALVVGACSWYAVSAFPLRQSSAFVPAQQAAPGPLEQRASAITPENPIPRRLTSEKMLYPAEAALVEARGEITLKITLDEFGRIAEARAIHFGITSPVMELSSASMTVGTEDLRDRFKGAILRAPGMRTAGKTAPMLEVYDAIARAATDAVTQWRYDPPFKAPISFPVTLSFGPVSKDLGGDPPRQLRSEGARVEVRGRSVPTEMEFVSSENRVSPTGPTSNDVVVRVGEGITAPTKVRDVGPVYPAIAQAAGVQGIVVMEVRIDRDGAIETAKVLRSIPLLDAAALDAVRQWRFLPTLLNGQPVAVVMTVTINFNLGQSERVPPWAPPANGSADRANFLPSWSPDGTKLVFISSRKGKPELYVVDRDGNGLRKLSDVPKF